MTELRPLREVIAKLNLNASKALGQNFILDQNLLDRIAQVPGKLEGQSVLEIGPGPGGLTRALLKAGAKISAIEKDLRCIPALTELKKVYPDSLSIEVGDALQFDHDRLLNNKPYHVVGNLPYNVGTALLVKWLNADPWPPMWKSLTLMFQVEVAERIIAKPNTKAFGRLSVLAQWRSDTQIAMKVHRSAFTPPPKVMSAVVHIEPRSPEPSVNPQVLAKLTEMAFAQRRKMLRQSLKNFSGAIEALTKVGIEPTRRPETVSVEEFVKVAQIMS